MNLAINYSTQAASLVTQGKVKVDRFKCPEWPDMIAEAIQLRPVAVHFKLEAGRGKLDGKNWGKVSHFLQLTNTPYVNFHLESRVDDFQDIPLDTTDPCYKEQIIERMVTDLNMAAREFGADRVIGENVPYRGPAGKILRPAAEPSIIQRVLAETGCGLLLDISHARIAAHYLGMEEHLYISQLPVERIREMHFTGVQCPDGYWQDHLAAVEEDWQALDWTIQHIRGGEWPKPWLLAFEYGGVGEKFASRSEPLVIEVQTARIHNVIRDL